MTTRDEALAELADVVTTKRGSYADHAAEFQQASAELAEATQLKPHEAANMAARYFELKNKTVRLVTTTGEKLTEGAWKKETDDLNAVLRGYIERYGQDNKGRYMTVSVEGQPDLELTPRGKDEIDASALLEHEAEIFFLLVERLQVAIDVKGARKVLNPDQQSKFNAFVHSMKATPSLGFKRGAE